MLRNYSGVGRLLASGPSLLVHRPELQAGPRMQMQISECLGQASCAPHALPPTQLCPCPARKGEAAPGYARNAAGSSMQQEERAACYPESGQGACCQGEEGLPLLFFWIPTCPSSWNQVAQDTPSELPQPRGQCSSSAFPRGVRTGGSNCWVPVAPLTAMSSSNCLKKCPPEPQSLRSMTAF